MTHDELLAKIDKIHKSCTSGGSDKDVPKSYNWPCYNLHSMAKALYAVAELHPMWTDYKYTETDKELVEFCGCCQEKYPCPTIQAIEKELA